ncbi:unnamed protein product [Discosporangium mesarthrocarpum]
MFNTIHVDETWFYLMVDDQKVRMFPGEDKPGAPTVEPKSHIPKAIFITANGQPDSAHISTGCWESGAYDAKGGRTDQYEPQEGRRYTGVLLLTIKKKMPWLRGKRIVVQKGGATPHTVKGNPEMLTEAGKKGGWANELVTQPVQFPDLNINDLGFLGP